jgi:hypothetical protein
MVEQFFHEDHTQSERGPRFRVPPFAKVCAFVTEYVRYQYIRTYITGKKEFNSLNEIVPFR